MKIKLLLTAFVMNLSVWQNLQAQIPATTCLTDIHNQELAQRLGIHFDREAFEQQLQEFAAKRPKNAKITGQVYQIPTVIHVVSEAGCSGISKAQVLNGLQIVNQDFRRQNPDTADTRAIFKPYAADTEIEFVLAKLNPTGGGTDGIVRVTSPAANAPYFRDDVKTVSPAWPTDKYFNIWIVDKIYAGIPGTEEQGFSQIPGIGQWNTYGAVIVHSQWGKQGAVAGSTAISSGREATHTIAHCFDLIHDFGQCSSNDHCNSGDRIGDTPPLGSNASTACNFSSNSCSLDVGPCSPYTTDVPDQIENYMSLSTCQNMFTQGQKTRMRDIISFMPQLSNLVSPANFAATGIDPNLSVANNIRPIPYFCANVRQVCAGTPVSFTDLSYNTPALSRTWTFPGGTPATSTIANPVVTYNTPGTYAVELEVTNNVGVEWRTDVNYITVVPNTNLVNIAPPNLFIESFEHVSFPVHSNANRTWNLQTNSITANPLNWQRVTTAASDGTASMRLQNPQIPQGTVSTLITPNFENSSSYLLFDLAYAKRNSANPTEELHIYASTDCGQTWGNPIKTMIGNLLVTNGGTAMPANFIPTASEWRMQTVNLSASLTSASQIMFKIEAKSYAGGNLYLDNFRLANVLSASESVFNKHKIAIFPNPFTAETELTINLNKPETVNYVISDITGKIVYESSQVNLATGENSIALTEKLLNVQAGVYLVQVKAGSQVFHYKLVKQ